VRSTICSTMKDSSGTGSVAKNPTKYSSLLTTTRNAGKDRLVGSPEPSLPETHPDRAFRYATFFIFEQFAWTKREAKAEPRDRHYCDHEEERGVNANVTEVHS